MTVERHRSTRLRRSRTGPRARSRSRQRSRDAGSPTKPAEPLGTPFVTGRSAVARSLGGRGWVVQSRPLSVVFTRLRQAPALLQGTVPSAEPTSSETKVIERG